MAAPKGRLVTPVGFDPSGYPRALNLDASDRLKVLVDSVTDAITVTGAGDSYLFPTSKVKEYTNLDLPAGNSNQDVLVIPAGETWRIALLSYEYIGTVTNVTLTPYVYAGAVYAYINRRMSVVSGAIYQEVLDVILSGGDTIGVRVTAATLDDNFYGWIIASRIH